MNIEYPDWSGLEAGLSGLEFMPPADHENRARERTAVDLSQTPSGAWRYPIERRRGLRVWLALGVSASSHAAFFFAFTGFKDPEPAPAATETVEIGFAAPPIPPEELLSDDVVDMTGETGEALAGIDVPSLPDLPTTVDLGDFTQIFDMASLVPRADVKGANNLSTIPGNFRRGGGGGTATSIGNIFTLSDLDRAPSPTFQPAPTVPAHMMRGAESVQVTVEFIVSVKGAVLEPRVVRSDNEAFDEIAIRAIKKWKFRPGYRRGKTVNVRMQQPMRFTATE
jgi:TonB family protein